MKTTLFVGKFAGIKVYLHWTFLMLLVWITVADARNGLSNAFWSLTYMIGVFVCVTLHEFGHALAARQYGIQTHDVTLYPIGGVASLERLPDKPIEELIVALAGPVVNIIIAFILAPFVDISSVLNGLPVMKEFNAQTIIPALFAVNVILPIFNLIPAFPMDGGRVLRAILSFKIEKSKATRIAATLGQAFAIFLIFKGFSGNPFLIFIGLFVFLGAEAEAQYAESQVLLRGLKVRDAVMRQFPKLSIDNTVGEAVNALLDSMHKSFLIVENDKIVGIITDDDIFKAVGEKGENTLIGHIMHKGIPFLAADMPLEESLTALKENAGFMPVVQDNQIVGVIDIENIIELTTIRKARLNPTTIT